MRTLLAILTVSVCALGAVGCSYEHHDHYRSHAADCYLPQPQRVVVVRHDDYHGGYRHHGYYRGSGPDCR